MKTIFLTLHFFALSVLIVSCTKTDTDIQSIVNKPAVTVKSNGESGGGIVSRTADIPPTSICTPTVVTLFAGQTINAGTVTVSNDANFIYVTYNTANGYVLTQTHLYVGDCALIPVNKPGNPIPGQFPYSTTHNNLSSYTYQIPITALPMGTCGCIAAHAVVVKLDAAGTVVDQQTGWGNGTVINPDGQWGMKFSYCSCTQ